jgi:hypothetical protein
MGEWGGRWRVGIGQHLELQAALHVCVSKCAGQRQDATRTPCTANVPHKWQLRVWVRLFNADALLLTELPKTSN